MKFPIKDFFSKCDRICSFLRIRSHLLKKSLMENFIFSAVQCTLVHKKSDALRELVPFVQFKNVKSTQGGVLISVTKSESPLWVLFMFFNLYKWCQIVQNIIYVLLAHFMTLVCFNTSSKTSENQRFSDIFRGCKKQPVT